MFVVLQNCHLESQGQKPNQSPTTLVAPPPLTPINTLKTAGMQPSTSVLPKLQRIPRSDDNAFQSDSESITGQLPDLPKLTPRPIQSSPKPTEISALQASITETNKSIVGSVTSWLPHNAKIVENIPHHTSEEPTPELPRPQYVEFLAGRKFLVIPKHNFVSVSPNVAATAISKTAIAKTATDAVDSTSVPVDSASLGPVSPTELKPEPESPSKPENSLTIDVTEVENSPNETLTAKEGDEKEDGKIVDKDLE